VVLATQNPVDLDYKGLSNTGTWFLGRLQTERDKARVIEGLEGAAVSTGASFDRSAMEQTLAGLGSRRFLMNNVHEDQPVVFETRWAMSYLRGPLARTQIQKLVEERSQSGPVAAVLPGGATHSTLASVVAGAAERQPETAVAAMDVDPRTLVPSSVTQKFAEVQVPVGSGRIVYRPAVLATGQLHFVRATWKVDEWTSRTFLATLRGDELPRDLWASASLLDELPDLDDQPVDTADFAVIPLELQQEKQWSAWEKDFLDFLYRHQQMELFRCKELKAFS
jgi:hypothetical protein